MEHLTITRSLGFSETAVISFYGAGGKTTLMRRLAAEMAAAGKKALLTTTTRIYKPPEPAFFYSGDLEQAAQELKEHFRNNNLAVLGKSILPDGKVEGIEPGQVGFLRDCLQVSVLVEADGAKGKPLKGFAPYEPVIPPSADYIIPVLGGDALGSFISPANTHRLEHFLEGTGAQEGEKVNGSILARAFKYMLKIGLDQAPKAYACPVINKSDLIASPETSALEITGLIRSGYEEPLPEKLLVTAGREDWPVKIILNLRPTKPPALVSCVILAAGKSARMGADKLTLTVGDKTILEQTLENVAASGLEDIVIVTSPGGTGSIPASGLKPNRAVSIKVVKNYRYQEGMSASLKAGLQAVDPAAQGVLFALGDQPHVPPAVYNRLCENYMNNLALVTSPVFMGKRGNPVLLDRRTWPALMNLTGDKGGRDLIDNMGRDKINYVDVDTPSVLWDIDSPEDYLVYLDHIFTRSKRI